MPRRLPSLLLLVLALGLAACGSEDTKLKVTKIEPTEGDYQGGTYVRVYGNRFIKDGARNAKVYFGSTQGTVVRTANDTELIIEAPGGKIGDTVDVLIIFEPGGEMKLKNAFTFIEKSDMGPSVEDLDTSKVKK